MKKKTGNPLLKRIPKELIGEWKTYLVVSLFLILTIGFISGMYVANGSMMKAADEGITKYNLEDGHFELEFEADSDLIKAIESGNKADTKAFYPENAPAAAIYENFFRNEEEDSDMDGVADGTVRVYVKNENINLASILEGRFPETEDEIAVDRMHADNAGIQVGDEILVSGQSWQVVGLIAYVNYSTLHEKNTDMMFDALNFNVAMVTEDGFERLPSEVHYSYAWQYENAPADVSEEKEFSDSFLKVVLTQSVAAENELQDYLPRYLNSAVNFATEDMGSDMAMGGVLLYILMAIIAFIFAVTISNTIRKEASAIGTLRAMGYTRGELTVHYLAMPVIITVLAAVIGNILGYSLFKNVVISMYYNSYSLPTYETVWSSSAFLRTTVVPICMMFVINLAVIVYRLQLTPLQFLRHDFKKKQKKKTMRLPRWNFFARYRMRIILQNIPNYLILFVGIFFVAVMMSMAVGMPSTLKYYQEHASEMMISRYQYVLASNEDEDGALIETENDTAEPFALYSLVRKGGSLEEDVSVYGISENSRYIDLPEMSSLSGYEVYISDSYADKYSVRVGDTVVLDEKYESTQYEFEVKGLVEGIQSIAVFLPIENYRVVFDTDDTEFTGFFSETEITDLDEDLTAAVITEREITKMADQLDHSMGAYMTYFQYLCIFASAILIYLLTKIILEKNETSISMIKILGYMDGEIVRLYLFSTTIVVVITGVISAVLGMETMKYLWKMIMADYAGWYTFRVSFPDYLRIFLFILLGYLIVLVIDYLRIRKIKMDEALKNME